MVRPMWRWTGAKAVRNAWVCDNMAKNNAIKMIMIDQLPKAALTDNITYGGKEHDGCVGESPSGRRRDSERGRAWLQRRRTREKNHRSGTGRVSSSVRGPVGSVVAGSRSRLFYGLLEPNEEIVIEEMARKMLTSLNATIFPGPCCSGRGTIMWKSQGDA